MSENGLVTQRSVHSAATTLDRLETAVKAAGLTVFARIDHAAGAAAVGMALRPLTVLIFGNAKGGTPLMVAQPTIGIDLPLKMLVWEDAQGQVWVTYNDPHFLARRHDLGNGVEPVLAALTAALEKLTQAAT